MNEPIMGELQRTLGLNVRAWRLSRGWSQDTLAEIVGLCRTYISSIELGKRNVRLVTVERLAAGIGVSPLDLLAE